LVTVMSDGKDPQREWRSARVRNSSEVRRWRPVIEGPPFVLGIDDTGGLLQFVGQTNEVIPADSQNALFFLPLLDMEYADFVSRITDSASLGRDLQTRAEDLVQVILGLALRQRASPYVERALRWLETLQPNDETREALRDLVDSRRGTQKLRQSAARLLRRQ
jgi:hypothetical protein